MQIPAEPPGQALRGDQNVNSPQVRAGKALDFKEISISMVLLSLWLASAWAAGVCHHYLSRDSPSSCFSSLPHSASEDFGTSQYGTNQTPKKGPSIHHLGDSDTIIVPSRSLSFLHSEAPSCSRLHSYLIHCLWLSLPPSPEIPPLFSYDTGL